jgi:hypothetical protein
MNPVASFRLCGSRRSLPSTPPVVVRSCATTAGAACSGNGPLFLYAHRRAPLDEVDQRLRLADDEQVPGAGHVDAGIRARGHVPASRRSMASQRLRRATRAGLVSLEGPRAPQAALVGLPIGGASPLGSHHCIDALNPTLPFLG